MPLEPVDRGSGRLRPGGADFKENPRVKIESRVDRNLQDEIIRYLTDTQSQSTYKTVEFLKEPEAERAKRFSRFLARRYYRDRLQRGFHYSSALLASSDSASEIVNTPEFESVFDTCVLGSVATSKNVGQLAIARLSPLRLDPWWSELLKYEFAFFLQLATSETAEPGSFPIANVSAALHHFHLRIPELLLLLKSGGAGLADLGGETTLLFSRTVHGKVYVAEIDGRTASVFTALNANSSAADIAGSCGLPTPEFERILAALSDIGAVVLPTAATRAPAV